MRGGDDEMIPVVSADDEAATTLVADLHDGIGQQWCLAVAFLLHDLHSVVITLTVRLL
jgi:hypothetical protein